MQSRLNLVLWCFIIIFGISGCARVNPDNPKDYYQWINDPEHGLIDTKVIGRVRIGMKFLPGKYLASQQIRATGQNADLDSISHSYDNQLCFLVSVSATDNNGEEAGVMFSDISSSKEYMQRVNDLNFGIKDMMSIRYGGEEYPAVLSTMENTYELAKERDILVVFPKVQAHWHPEDTIDVVLDDRSLKTGISHFRFAVQNIDEISVY